MRCTSREEGGDQWVKQVGKWGEIRGKGGEGWEREGGEVVRREGGRW